MLPQVPQACVCKLLRNLQVFHQPITLLCFPSSFWHTRSASLSTLLSDPRQKAFPFISGLERWDLVLTRVSGHDPLSYQEDTRGSRRPWVAVL